VTRPYQNWTVVIVTGQGQLTDVVRPFDAGRRRSHLLHGRQQQPDEDGDDRDHHQQLDERKSRGMPGSPSGRMA